MGQLGRGPLVIQFVHGRTQTSYMILKGEEVRAKQFMTQKRQKEFLHIDLTYYQGNKTCIHTPVV